jgi:hypothetical protein
MALLNPKRLTADYPGSWANIIYYTFHITGLLVMLPNSCTTIQEPTFRRQKTAETPLTLYQPPKPKAHLYLWPDPSFGVTIRTLSRLLLL